MTHPLTPFRGFYQGRRVAVTGHTGFKGSWLSHWLLSLGAQVHGLALPPDGDDPLFDVLDLGRRTHHTLGDIRDEASVTAFLGSAQPEVLFHLAAQPLVRRSYAEPVLTFDTNVSGTSKVLQAARSCTALRAVVVVTTDKVYRDQGWPWPYRESDALGGHDPYSASKAACEIVVQSYADAFFTSRGVRVATARAGNVIGGGDRSADRLVPDFVRAIERGEALRLRNPRSVRPWQHVLEPLSGYLDLGEQLSRTAAPDARAWNFGPDLEGSVTVERLARLLVDAWGAGTVEVHPDAHAPHETAVLRLDASRAREQLGWGPAWDIEEAVANTAHWYRAQTEGAEGHVLRARTDGQIEAYTTAAARRGLGWAVTRPHETRA